MDNSLSELKNLYNLPKEVKDKLIGFFEMDKKEEDLFEIISSLEGPALFTLYALVEENKRFGIYNNFLTPNQASFFIDLFNSSPIVSMSQDSIKAQYGYEEKGIKRSTFFSPQIAQRLFRQMQILNYNNSFSMSGSIESKKLPNSLESQNYEFAMINPVFRFVKYSSSQSLIPHYDKSIEKSASLRSTHTLIIYLSPNSTGATRLIKEKFENHELKDWDKSQVSQLLPSDIYKEITPERGRLFIFEHGLLHDGAPVEDEEKLILTTEIFSYLK